MRSWLLYGMIHFHYFTKKGEDMKISPNKISQFTKSSNENQKIEFIGIIFAVYLLVSLYTDPFGTNTFPYKFALIILIMTIVLHQVVPLILLKLKIFDEKELNQNVTDLLKVVSYVFLGILVLLYILSGIDIVFLHFAQLCSPATTYLLYCKIMKNSTIQSDNWIVMKKELERFAVREKVVHLVPVFPSKSKKSEKLIPLEIKYQTSTNTSNIHSRRKGKNDLRIKIENAAFFLKNRTDGKEEFAVPNKETFQFLDANTSLSVPRGVRKLESNSLIYLFQLHLFGMGNEEKDQQKLALYDFSKFLRHGENRRTLLNPLSETGGPIYVVHKWKVEQLQSSASLLLRSIVGTKRNENMKMLAEMFDQNLSNVTRNHQHLNEIILCYISILSKLSTIEPIFHRHRWTGILTGFAHACRINMELNLESFTNNKTVKNQEAKHICEFWQRHIDLVNRDPVAEFIKVHDHLIKSQNSKWVELDKVIHTLMGELEKTVFKQRLVEQQKFDSQQLVEIRSGLVAGITIGLEVIKRRVGVKNDS